MLPQDSCIILIFAFEYKMHTQGIITLHVIYNTKLYQLKNTIYKRGKEDNGSQRKINTWQEIRQIRAKAKRKDNHKYSNTNMSINCPRTMSVKGNIFPVIEIFKNILTR